MSKKGFTLTEILIVLVIITILVLIAFPRGLKAIQKSEEAANRSNLKTLDSAVMLCYADKRKWDDCKTEQLLIDGNYLKETITHPCGGTYTPKLDTATGGYFFESSKDCKATTTTSS